MDLEEPRVERLLADQRRVVSRAQLQACGLSPGDIRRCLRRRLLSPALPRVLVDHTGPLTGLQRAWAAVLYAGPAALCGPWVHVSEHHTPPGPVHVAIDHSRRLSAPDGVVVHRLRHLAGHVRGGRPPRLRYEDNALLTVQAAAGELDVVAALTDTIGRHGVRARDVRSALARFPRLPRRAFVSGLLDDLDAGTCSVLEHLYLERVERAHGLPRGHRQVLRETAAGRELRDVEYLPHGLVVELDGRLGHGTWEAGGRDADRDLDDLAAGGKETARLRWKQVTGTPCRTAERIARILRRRGWTGTATPCGPGCDLATGRPGSAWVTW